MGCKVPQLQEKLNIVEITLVGFDVLGIFDGFSL